MARAKPVPVFVFAGPSGAALSSAVCPDLRVAAVPECAGLLVPMLNIAAMRARCISAWPNVRANRAQTAWRQRPAGENVPRTAGRALVACRWCSG